MGIEFRLDRSDHRITEAFLEQRPAHVGAIVIEAPNLQRQADAAAAAKANGVGVVVETLTERLAHPGLVRRDLDYFDGDPFGPDELANDADRTEFVKRVIEVQIDHATVVVPPHFYADTPELLALNIDLVARTAALDPGMPVRAVCTVPRSVFRHIGPVIAAKKYRLAGATQIDLRISPLGGHDEGTRKILDALKISAAFRSAPLEVTLGLQGHVGPTAIATGAADNFSVGVGYRERMDFKSLLSSQKREPDPDASFGSPAGIHLPGADITIKRKLGRELLADPKLRGRLGVHTELLADPTVDPRRSYLETRHQQITDLLGRPETMRADYERSRLQRAADLRSIINDYHLPAGTSRLKTRTLESLQVVCQRHEEEQAA